ncbi:hypothetical protein [Streptomyces xanthochromogenes]|uniref:hypothetical protein n=1 Tax=Streptomyces xanthochromogenes TaxID=67384 RepID=UPI00167A7907|nr:hypothetical protein [Streptomyces xanthochromogenes]
MFVDRGHQLASRTPNRGIAITGQCVRDAPTAKHGTVSCVLHLDPWRIGVFEDRPQQLDDAGPAGDGVSHREIPQKRNRFDRRVGNSQLTEPQTKITQR